MVEWCLSAHVNEPTIFPLSTAYIPATNYMVLLMVWEIVYTFVSYSFLFEKQLVLTDRGIL